MLDPGTYRIHTLLYPIFSFAYHQTSQMKHETRIRHTFTGFSKSQHSGLVSNSPLPNRPNIPLSASRRITRIAPTSHLSYIPPHPQRGTPYHRYVLLLLPHITSPTTPIDIPVPSDAERLGFDLRTFVAQWGLDAAQGGGAHMWREEWDAGVSEVYRDVLGKSA